MDKPNILNRLHEIEKELQLIRSGLEDKKENKLFLSRVKIFLKIIVDNWVLISCIAALMTAVYIKYAYNNEYFEQYRNEATTKKLVKFYRQFGSEMLLSQEYEVAADSFKNALKLKSNDIDSALWLVKANVFTPPEGMKYIEPKIIDNKLRYLLKLFPDDPELLILKSFREWNKQNYDGAISLVRESINLNPNIIAAYDQLGYYLIWRGDIKSAIKCYEEALEMNSEHIYALNNLGFLNKLIMNLINQLNFLVNHCLFLTGW